MRIINSRYAVVLTAILLLQAGTYYALTSRPDATPSVQPLAKFPPVLGDWQLTRDMPLEKEVLDVLKADDTLNREYVNSAQTVRALFFIAFFKTQRYGQAPHSPKNCLPGAGWEPSLEGRISIPIPGRAEPIVTNKYVVSRGEDRSVVLYWYQSHNRVIASEYSAKFWLVADSIRYRRSDTALVRVVVPVTRGVDAAVDAGTNFVVAAFPEVLRQIP